MIYLNNGATTFPKPNEVIEAVNECISNPPIHSGRSGIDEDCEDIIYACRIKLAKLFNVDNPNQIVFTSGSTEALNLALKGINLTKGHVISTTIEHNSVIRPLMTLQKEGVITVDFVDTDNTGWLCAEDIEKAIKPNTKAIVVNHASNVTGTELDLKSISAVAHKHNCLFIVDASQSAGALPIDVKDMGIDLLAFTGHKSLYGLSGIGGLYIKEGLDLKPLKTGGTGVKSEELLQPKEMPLYYESGTPNMPGIVSLNAGLAWIEKTGIEIIHSRKKMLLEKVYNELRNYPAVRCYNSTTHNSYSNFCFNIGEMVPEEIHYILESSYDIHVRSGLHCAPLILKPIEAYPWGTVRMSPSYFTSEVEIDKFIEAIKEIVQTFVKPKM